MIIRLQRSRGSVILAVMMASLVLGIMLAAYLDLISAQHQAIARSQTWNSSIPVAEGGVEEALAHLYQTKGTNLVSNGWYYSPQGCFKWRNMGDGYVLVVISNTAAPVVYSTAFMRAPVNGDVIRRTVMVETRRDGMFTKGMVAKGQITLNGNNIVVDSFDSQDPNYSTNGLYLISKRKANGDVATNSGLVNSLLTGNANIFGHVSTGPEGTVGIGNNGAVGDLGWQNSGGKGIQPGSFADDMNVSFPDVTLPFVGGFNPGSATGYQYVIDFSGDFRITSLTGSLLVKSNVQARLIVDSEISLTGQDKITIQPGASLNLYMAGSTTKIGGGGVVDSSGNATNFFYWGTTNNTVITINGNGAFTGVIYAPNASYTMNGGGSSQEDMAGALITKSVQMNGDVGFHYDESLGRLYFNRGYIVTTWNEI